MRPRTRSKPTVALGAAIAVLFLAASPASAVVVTGVIRDGTTVVLPNFRPDPIVFDVSGGDPGGCSDPNDPVPAIDIDVAGDATNGSTEVVQVDINPVHVWFDLGELALDIDLAPGPAFDNTGTYSGGPSTYTVDQDLGLAIDVYSASGCDILTLDCHLDVQLSLSGSFSGTMSPPASGTLVLDGGGTLVASNCELLLTFAFYGALMVVQELVVDL